MLNKVKLVWSKTNRWHRVLLIFLLVESKLLPGGQVGFQCNDPALSYPYTGDTVSWKWLMAITLLLPPVVMLMVERQRDKMVVAKKHALSWYKEYVFGFLLNLTLIQCIKSVVGSPRPHFFDTCRPKEAETCEASEYISSYTCTKAYWLNQSDRSFPSGHTSLAFHMGIFVVYYLNQRAGQINFRSILSIQVLCMTSAIYCAVSRMMDHRHHWWDVLAGAVLTAPILVYTIVFLCKNFECTAPKSDNNGNQREVISENTNGTPIETK
ncbi:phospholipid phosphatase homolog 1.2 homolog [Pararge aegeria]|uniref:phospholipid phosphatase homolog 1.2 homolog n=1 Tax=Pararge aegeria TaxID=116150 RepID=UPI0019D26CB1|nr:phospholipid phosphatase homolog 1.2 homolog [Pararge aegeria]XP_039758952.1 phospholipid phosphatase homolog 1.2 homolog [Pararge aegeria]XP_039758954.1 phospholipid phosphatase homolog 1.2 homolog [Pararge aegeria]